MRSARRRKQRSLESRSKGDDQFSIPSVAMELPDAFVAAHPGPRFGIAGTRELAGVHGRPVVGTIVKPSVGLSPDQTAALVKTLAEADIDFVKDDELMADPPHSPLELQGAIVFQNKQCRNCHALDGLGGKRGPDLTFVGMRLTHDQLIDQVSNGTPGGGNMPAYGKQVNPAEMTALTSFLVSLRPAKTEPARMPVKLPAAFVR